MRFIRMMLAVIGLLISITGCDQQALIDKATPADEAAIAKDMISKLAAKDFAPIEARLDPAIMNSSTHAAHEEAAKVMPPGAPKSITTIGTQTIVGGGVTRYNLTFEYEYPAAWIVANVVLQRRDGPLTVYGLHVNFLPQSLKKSIDLLLALKDEDSYGATRQIASSLRWVPASQSGLTAPTLHRLTSGVPALK